MAGIAVSAASSKPDIFLIYASLDERPVLAFIAELKKICLTIADHKSEDFQLGKSVFDNISEAIENANLVLLYVSENSLKSRWVGLETVLALEKAARTRHMSLRLVMETSSSVQDFKTGDLATVPLLTFDYNKKDWAEEVMQQIKVPVEYHTVLPAGNVALGLVYAYFIGFLRNILPGLKKAITESEVYKKNPDQMSRRFHILCPHSCRAASFETKAETGGYQLEKEGAIYVDVNFGGNFRKFDVPLFRITKGDEKFYFLGEVPSILDTMFKLIDLDLVKLDVRLQIQRFVLTLDELVNHRSNEVCNDTVTILPYDDTNTSVCDVIWTALRSDIQQPLSVIYGLVDIFGSEPTIKLSLATDNYLSCGDLNHIGRGLCSRTSGDMVTAPLRFFTQKSPTESELLVRIVHGGMATDKAAADEISTALVSKGLSPPDKEDSSEGPAINDVSCVIILLSMEAIKNANMEKFYTKSVSDATSAVRVIPVMVDATIKQLPTRWRWVQVLMKEEEYIEKIWNTLTGAVPLSRQLQSGNMSIGLAYTFVCNYMSQNMFGKTADGKDFNTRFLDGLTKYGVSTCPCLPVIFELVPRSCSFPTQTTPVEGEEHLGILEPAVVGTRKYFLHLFKMTLASGKEVCYAREFATPAITLHEMAHKYSFAGLSVDDMEQQAELFSDLVTSIIANQHFIQTVGDMRQKLCIINFDDSKESIAEALKINIEEKLAEGNVLSAGT